VGRKDDRRVWRVHVTVPTFCCCCQRSVTFPVWRTKCEFGDLRISLIFLWNLVMFFVIVFPALWLAQGRCKQILICTNYVGKNQNCRLLFCYFFLYATSIYKYKFCRPRLVPTLPMPIIGPGLATLPLSCRLVRDLSVVSTEITENHRWTCGPLSPSPSPPP